MSFLKELSAHTVASQSGSELQLGAVSVANLTVQGTFTAKGPIAVLSTNLSPDGGALPILVTDPVTRTGEVKYIALLDAPVADVPVTVLTLARTEHLIALEALLTYIQTTLSVGSPTKVSRLIYLFGAAFAFSWTRVVAATPASSETPVPGVFPRSATVSGVHDDFDLDVRVPLDDSTQAATWFIHAIADFMPRFIPGYDPAPLLARERAFHQWTTVQQNMAVALARNAGNWPSFLSAFNAWWDARATDGWNTTGAYVATAADVPSIATPLVINSNADPGASAWQPLQFPDGHVQNYLGYRWGTVRTSCLTSADETELMNYAANFFPTEPQRAAEVANVAALSTQAQLTDSLKMLAEFYAGGPGTVTPPGMFAWLYADYVRRFLPENYASRRGEVNAQVLILLDLGVHLFEGCRITWALKAEYVQARPIAEIRHRLRGDVRTWWYGTGDASGWVPYQTSNFVTPPFPDYPSGHSHFSRAFADTMGYWFGNNIEGTSLPVPRRVLTTQELTQLSPIFSSTSSPTEGSMYADFLVPTGASEIQPGTVPAAPFRLKYTESTWAALATDAGMSRLYGGIHCLSAHVGSTNVADMLDTKIRAAWNIKR